MSIDLHRESEARIAEIVRRIVAGFRPDRIILFGSHARGDAGPDSDVDLLVVMSVSGSRRRRATEIDLALLGIDVPTDVFVVTPEQVERERNQVGAFIGPALREGRVLYARAV